MRAGARCVPVMLVSLVLACRRDDPKSTRGADSALNAADRRAPLVETKNRWFVGEVVKRLREGGLVVSDSGPAVHHEGLHVPGTKLNVGGESLELYVYDSSGAQRRDALTLDTISNAALPPARRPRFIESGNLIAIHTTKSDAMAERVDNILTARHADAP